MSIVNSNLLDLCNLPLDSFPLTKKPQLQRVIPKRPSKREPLDDNKLTELWQQALRFFENECMPSCVRIQKRIVSHEPCDYDDLLSQLVTLITKITEATSKVSFLTKYIPTMQDSYLQRDALCTSLYLAPVADTAIKTAEKLHTLLSSKTYREACTHYQKTVQECIDLRMLATVDEKITGLFVIFTAAKKHTSSRTMQFIHYTAGCLKRETLEDQSDYKRVRLAELYSLTEKIARRLPELPKPKPSDGTLQELEASITALSTKVQAQIKGIYFGTLSQNKEEYKEYESTLVEHENSLHNQYDLLAKHPLGIEPKDDWGRLEYLKTELQKIRHEIDCLKELTTESLEFVSKALSKLITYLTLSHLGIMPDPNYIRLDTLSAHFEALDLACTIKVKESPHFTRTFKLITRTLSHTVGSLALSPNEETVPSKIFARIAIPEAEYELVQSYLMKKLLAHVYFGIVNDFDFQIAYRMLREEPVFAPLRKISNQQMLRLQDLYGKAPDLQDYLEYQLFRAALFALTIESRGHTQFDIFLSYCEAKQLLKDIKDHPEPDRCLPWLENKFNEFSSRHKEVVKHEIELSDTPLFTHLITALYSASTGASEANQKIRASIERAQPKDNTINALITLWEKKKC